MVYREVCVSKRGELSHAPAEVVHQVAHVALLTKYNDLLEIQGHKLAVPNTNLKKKDRQMSIDHRQSIFRAGLHRHVLLQNVKDMQRILKYEGVQLMLHPCFAEL